MQTDVSCKETDSSRRDPAEAANTFKIDGWSTLTPEVRAQIEALITQAGANRPGSTQSDATGEGGGLWVGGNRQKRT